MANRYFRYVYECYGCGTEYDRESDAENCRKVLACYGGYSVIVVPRQRSSCVQLYLPGLELGVSVTQEGAGRGGVK